MHHGAHGPRGAVEDEVFVSREWAGDGAQVGQVCACVPPPTLTPARAPDVFCCPSREACVMGQGRRVEKFDC
jgi:hypothetical protein